MKLELRKVKLGRSFNFTFLCHHSSYPAFRVPVEEANTHVNAHEHTEQANRLTNQKPCYVSSPLALVKLVYLFQSVLVTQIQSTLKRVPEGSILSTNFKQNESRLQLDKKHRFSPFLAIFRSSSTNDFSVILGRTIFSLSSSQKHNLGSKYNITIRLSGKQLVVKTPQIALHVLPARYLYQDLEGGGGGEEGQRVLIPNSRSFFISIPHIYFFHVGIPHPVANFANFAHREQSNTESRTNFSEILNPKNTPLQGVKNI